MRAVMNKRIRAGRKNIVKMWTKVEKKCRMAGYENEK